MLSFAFLAGSHYDVSLYTHILYINFPYTNTFYICADYNLQGSSRKIFIQKDCVDMIYHSIETRIIDFFFFFLICTLLLC